MKLILIDCGTTNTRIRIVNKNSRESMSTLKINVGVKNSAIENSNYKLKTSIEEGIDKILVKNSLKRDEIEHIVASGMITSNLGLKEVPHIVAPASLDDFANSIEKDRLAGITCYFIPGMKNADIGENPTLEDIKNMDIMRGEEVEAFGLLDQINETGNGLIILPGSHTKYILVDEDKKLLSCFSTLGGELIHAVQSSTIISNSLKNGLIKEMDLVSLEEGYKATIFEGMTRALFRIRLLDLYSSFTENQRANFLLGSIISEDIRGLKYYLKNRKIDWIVVGGSQFLREGMTFLLSKEFSNLKIITATEEQVENSYIIGSILIQDYINNRGDVNV